MCAVSWLVWHSDFTEFNFDWGSDLTHLGTFCPRLLTCCRKVLRMHAYLCCI